jgi:hypothetical protein
MVLAFARAGKISLRNDPQYIEKWLHDRIAEDPAILGLGELELLIS